MMQIPINNLSKGDQELKIIPLGHFMPYDYQKPHRHSYFEFFAFEKGGGSHFIDFVEHPINDYTIHLVFPQQIHLVKRTEKASGSILICSKNFVNLLGKFFYPQLVRNNYSVPILGFSKTEFEALKQTLASIENELLIQDGFSYNLAQNYAAIFLTQCIRQKANKPLAEEQKLKHSLHDWEVYKTFSDLLEMHFLDKATVAFYAQKMAISVKVLNTSIRKVVGKTVVELLQERTLIEAKGLLLHTDDSIKEIAYKLNFKDSSYFTRFFAKQEKSTPKEFKLFWENQYYSKQ